MIRSPVVQRTIVAVAFAALTPSVAAATGWIRLPNGKLAYQTDYTSSAMFTCSKWIIVGSCSATSNAVTLSNGGSQLTLTWVPNPAPLTAGFFSAPAFSMGSIQKTVTGTEQFVLPSLANPRGPLFNMQFDIATAGLPPSGSQAIFFSFVLNSATSLRVGGNSTWHTLGYLSSPAGASGKFWMHAGTPAAFDVSDGAVEILATSGIATPEPVTLVLLGSGLLGVGGMVRRRRATRRDG